MSQPSCLKGVSREVRDAVEAAMGMGWTPKRTRRHIMLYGPNGKGLVLVSTSTKEPNVYKKIMGDIKRESGQMKITKAELNKLLVVFEEKKNKFPKLFLEKWCADRDIPVEVITMYCNRHPVLKLRNQAIRDFRAHYPEMSYPQIGKVFKRNHTTIMSALGVLKKNRRH